jgi:hypothetical protein
VTLAEALHATFRRLHYAPRTEESYLHWIRAYIRFHGLRHPRELGSDAIVAFLDDLAVERRASASTVVSVHGPDFLIFENRGDRRAICTPPDEVARREQAHLPAAQIRCDFERLREHWKSDP